MENKQVANAYAVSKILGCDKSFDDFEKEYSQYYNQAIEELSSRPVETSKVEVPDLSKYRSLKPF